MKKRYIIIAIVCFGFFFVSTYFTQNTKSFLPNDLLYKNKPIHPSCIAATQFFSDDALEPKHVDCLHVKQPHGFSDTVERDNIKENLVSEDYKHKTIQANIEIKYPNNEYQYFLGESYSYITTYRNHHALIIKTEGLGSGRFTSLAFVKRDGDYIINTGTVLIGDRASGGDIKIEKIKDNILRFRYSDLYCGLSNYTASGSEESNSIIALPCFPYSLGFYSIAEVDMNRIVNAPPPAIVKVGIEFCDRDHYTSIKHEEKEVEEGCFNELALQYIDEKRTRLNIGETTEFASKVAKCIESKKDTDGTVAGNIR